MSEKDIAAVAYESGAKKLGEAAADRALNFVIDKVQKKYGEKKIEIGTVFERYLENATERLNQIKTIATGINPRNIIGENELYIKIGVDFRNNEIDTSRAENLIEHGKNIMIVGSGGVGKSMLMRYLFLRTAFDGDYIPVFVELRKLSRQEAGKISIEKLIADCMAQFDVELPGDEFVYSLRLGKYLFLFDGFDEIKETLAPEAAEKLQEFCSKYPNNRCIVTSRHEEFCHPLETFVVMKSKPLSKEQAVEFASKFWEKDEKTEEFCRQLETELFEKHQSFAENPLLLSMMFLTFMRNLSIPDHLADFYKKAYEALYSIHDNHDKGFYRRDFKCEKLDEEEFRLLFARFCFQTYLDNEYEFEEARIIDLITESADFFEFDIDPWDYLEDLKNAVCLIVKDGNVYRFAHRSFQAYFAAVYTAERLDDETQKRFFKDMFSTIIQEKDIEKTFDYWRSNDYLDLLNQIEHEKFLKNALEDELREIMNGACKSDNPDIYILKNVFFGVDLPLESYDCSTLLGCDKYLYFYCFIRYYIKHDFLPRLYNTTRIKRLYERDKSLIRKWLYIKDVLFDTIDNSNSVSKSEKEQYYFDIIKLSGIPLFREKALEWLKKLDDERADLKKKDYRKRL